MTDYLPPPRYALWHRAVEWPNEDGEFVGDMRVELSCGHKVIITAEHAQNRKRELKCLACRNHARDAEQAARLASIDLRPIDVEVIVTRR